MGGLCATVLDAFETLAAAFDLAENAFNACGPGVRDGVLVPGDEELFDGSVQFLDTAEYASLDCLLLEFGKPALNEVEPARAGRDEMQRETRALAKPGADPLVSMDRIVV